jgi:type IV conjugative transfer system coupling protein TraD
MPKSKIFHTDRFTRGGQIFTHEWRMRLQNFKTVFYISLIFASLGLYGGAWWYNINAWIFWDFWLLSYIGGHLKVFLWPALKAFLLFVDRVLRGLMPGSRGILSAHKHVYELMTSLITPHHEMIQIPTVEFLKHPWTTAHAQLVHKAFGGALIAWLGGMMMLASTFRKKSKRIEAEKLLRGKTMAPLFDVARLIKTSGKPTFDIAPNLPLPRGSENQHMAIIGATRMGKTNCMMGLLKQIRNRGQRAIVLDSTGEFTSVFYRPFYDKLLNPLDQRSEGWSVWSEHLNTYEYDAWATAMVPEGKTDPIWHENARKLLSFTARKLEGSNASMLDILKWCCWAPLNQKTARFYKNSPVASLMSPDAEKTAAGVRMHLSSAISAFEYLEKANKSFSIAAWVSQKQRDEWLFLTSLPSQRSTLAPLLASWFNFAFLGLERAGQDFDHRLWMVADELPGLDFPVSSLKTMVAEGAKYGACCLLGFQNKSQLEDIYGRATTRTLLSNCSTKVIFRSPDHETAHDLSLTLGEQDIIASTENFSLGAHQYRDGVNLAAHQRTQPLITATDIMSLNALEAYILLPGNLPTTKARFELWNLAPQQPPFTPKGVLPHGK